MVGSKPDRRRLSAGNQPAGVRVPIVSDFALSSTRPFGLHKIGFPSNDHFEVHPMPRRRPRFIRQSQPADRVRLQLFKLEDRLAPSTSIPLNAVSWTPIGPSPSNNSGFASSGRTTAIAAHPTDANILYIGAASGGVWKTTNATTTSPTWVPLT